MAPSIRKCDLLYSVSRDLKSGAVELTVFGKAHTITITLSKSMAAQLAKILRPR